MKNRVIPTILPIWPEFVLSATILCSLEPSLLNNTVRLSILFYFACHAPLKPYNLDVNLRFFENLAGIGKNLKTNIVTPVNLGPNFEFRLEFKSILNYLCVLIWGIYLREFWFSLDLKNCHFFFLNFDIYFTNIYIYI